MPRWILKLASIIVVFTGFAFLDFSPVWAEGKYQEKSISFLLDDQMVVGILTRPIQKKPPPIVLMLHGMSGNRHGPGGLFARAAKIWAENGLASLRISTGGRGGSEGKFHDMTLKRRTEEALAAVKWILGQSNLNRGQISILGHSQGTIIAASAAHSLENSHPIRSVILWAPQANPLSIYRSAMGLATLERGLDASPGEIVSWRGVGGRTRAFKSGFFRGLKSAHPLQDIAGFSGRLLVVTGRKDRWSTAESARNFLKAHAGVHTFTEFDVGHQMGARAGYEKIDLVATHTLEWLKAGIK